MIKAYNLEGFEAKERQKKFCAKSKKSNNKDETFINKGFEVR